MRVRGYWQSVIDRLRHDPVTLEVDDALVDAVVTPTTCQQQDEARARILAREAAYRAAFKPHLRTETTRTIPEPIFIAVGSSVADYDPPLKTVSSGSRSNPGNKYRCFTRVKGVMLRWSMKKLLRGARDWGPGR
jgi:hypothetical protein